MMSHNHALGVDRQHGVEELSAVVRGALLGLAERRTDELRVGRIELLAQLLDEMHKIVSDNIGKIDGVISSESFIEMKTREKAMPYMPSK